MPSENFAKIFSGRALNRPRESRGSQPSISLKHGRLAHVRSQFSLFRRSPTHKNLPRATFCTSERVFAVLFARRKKYQNPFPLQGVLRFCKPRISTQNNNFAQTKLNPLPLRGFSRRPCRLYVLPAATDRRLRRPIPCCCRNIFRRPAAALFGRKAAEQPHGRSALLSYSPLRKYA